jgi:hypothetical protein
VDKDDRTICKHTFTHTYIHTHKHTLTLYLPINQYNYTYAENIEVIETISDKTKKTKKGRGGIRNKARAVKHRNLATHLMNYSANPELNKASLTLKV